MKTLAWRRHRVVPGEDFYLIYVRYRREIFDLWVYFSVFYSSTLPTRIGRFEIGFCTFSREIHMFWLEVTSWIQNGILRIYVVKNQQIDIMTKIYRAQIENFSILFSKKELLLVQVKIKYLKFTSFVRFGFFSKVPKSVPKILQFGKVQSFSEKINFLFYI